MKKKTPAPQAQKDETKSKKQHIFLQDYVLQKQYSLDPFYLKDIKKYVQTLMIQENMKYSYEAGGVILSSRGINLSQSTGEIIDEIPLIQIHLESNVKLLRISEGIDVVGKIIKTSHDSITALCFDFFTTTILKENISAIIIKEKLENYIDQHTDKKICIGDVIQFKILKLQCDLQGSISLTGQISDKFYHGIYQSLHPEKRIDEKTIKKIKKAISKSYNKLIEEGIEYQL